MTDDEYGRLTALGQQLIETHHRLLDALDGLRAGDQPPRELAEHCLTFCEAVTRHHTEEDRVVFPHLAARHPGLRDLLDGLERDHRHVAWMLGQVAALAGRLDTDGARAELEGLAALLESHFNWEEKRLVAVLDKIGREELDPRW